jgi:hypothetical protein
VKNAFLSDAYVTDGRIDGCQLIEIDHLQTTTIIAINNDEDVDVVSQFSICVVRKTEIFFFANA